MAKNILFGALVCGLLAFPQLNLSAYEGQTVKNGGTIVGFVKFKGKAPVPDKLEVTKDKEVCGKTEKTDSSLIVRDGNVVDTVVHIVHIDKGKKMNPGKVTLDQRNCEYHPHVLAFPVGSVIEVLNSDGILHNIHSYSKKNPVFNMAQPKFRKKLTIKVEKPEAINVKCDVHNWMNGWLFAVDNPYYDVTDENGHFKLTDVPPGSYTLEAWHEKLGKVSKKVTVRPGEETHVNFEVSAK